jgi:hypothetical protein
MNKPIIKKKYFWIAAVLFATLACNLMSDRTARTPTPTIPPLLPVRTPTIAILATSTQASFPTLPPVPQATATRSIPPSPTVQPTSKTILQDDFSNPDLNGWSTSTSDDEFALINRSITNGKYVWQIRTKKAVATNVTPTMVRVSDFVASVTTQVIEGNKDNTRVGMVFRRADKSYYYVGYSDNGKVIAYVNINGQNVVQFSDTQIPSGTIGLICEILLANTDTKIEFDDFLIENP